MTVATALALVRDMLQDEPWSSTIGASYTAGGTTLTISEWEELVEGDVLDFQDDGTYEQFLVTTTPASSTVSVAGGYDGTSNQNHSNGARFYKSPRFRSNQVVQAITHVTNTRLWPELFIPSTSTVTPGNPPTTVLYDLPTDFLGVLNDDQYLVQPATGSIEDVRYNYGNVVQVPSSISSSTWALRVTRWERLDVDATLFYRAKVTTSNMTTVMEPVIALGAAAYLLSTEMAEKADRFDEDDRSGRIRRNAATLWSQFEQEKHVIAKQLSDVYGKPPVRHKRRRFG